MDKQPPIIYEYPDGKGGTVLIEDKTIPFGIAIGEWKESKKDAKELTEAFNAFKECNQKTY